MTGNPSFAPSLGLLGRSPFFARCRRGGLTLARTPPRRLVEMKIAGVMRTFALPITLTPFASVSPCSARCRFCSETLVHRDARTLSATLRPGVDYHHRLSRALDALTGLPLGVSLSGLEATDDADWLAATLSALTDFEHRATVESKVLYSNGAGLARETTGARLIPLLATYGLTRIELSRHHPDAARNQAIMRFRPDKPIAAKPSFERTVRDLRAAGIPLRLVCILQSGGVDSAAEIREYLNWAQGLGIDDVVFRELSRLGDLYLANRPKRYIDARRVVLEDLLDALWPVNRAEPIDFTPHILTDGYYYWNLESRWHNGMKVTFETSDYEVMKARHGSDAIYKLVFHANGNLCGDWDPDREVLLHTGTH